MKTAIYKITENQLQKAVGKWIDEYMKSSSRFDLLCKQKGYDRAMAETLLKNMGEK